VLTGLLPSSTAFASAMKELKTNERVREIAPSLRVGAPRECNHTRLRGDVAIYARLLDGCGVVGPAVEVGVLHGWFSRRTLLSYQGLTHLTLVDLWAQQPASVYGGDSANVNNSLQEIRYQKVLRDVVTPYRHCVSVLRMLSTDAARHFADDSLAFVYLDANHYYEHVMRDIQAYWPKVMPGGMLAGHDFGDVYNFGVQRAVTQFARAHRLRFTVTDPPLGKHREPICCSGWYIWKPKAPPPVHAPRAEDPALDSHWCYAWWLKTRVPCSALLDDTQL
jgi:hypothetical protein